MNLGRAPQETHAQSHQAEGGVAHSSGRREITVMAAEPGWWHAEPVDTGRFPPAFRRFLAENGISIDNYALDSETIPRYLRANPRSPPSEAGLSALRAQLGDALAPVEWLPGFYSLPASTKIAGTRAYAEGHVYGIDAASGAAVAALDLRPGHAVLDMCCAPGAKLCMAAEAVGPSGSVTGVDVHPERLAATRTMVRKYALANVRLFLGDARQFAAPAPPAASLEESPPSVPARPRPGKRRRQASARGAHEAPPPPQLFYPLHVDEPPPPVPEADAHDDPEPFESGRRLYERVLVDAECTHDGSVRHLSKYAAWGWETFEQRFLDPTRLRDLEGLQRALLRRGYAALAPGGVLVYSTCSFARRQNEEVVAWLLETEPHAECVPIDTLDARAPCKPGGLAHTLRFEPCASATSALFISRITKRAIKTSATTTHHLCPLASAAPPGRSLEPQAEPTAQV